jgi:hypothetical protein
LNAERGHGNSFDSDYAVSWFYDTVGSSQCLISSAIYQASPRHRASIIPNTHARTVLRDLQGMGHPTAAKARP